jgi:hypothetical protein
MGWCEMPTTKQLAVTRLNINNARCLALFASELQLSDAPTAEIVAQAINRAIRRLGVLGCAAGWPRSSATTPTLPRPACAGRASLGQDRALVAG